MPQGGKYNGEKGQVIKKDIQEDIYGKHSAAKEEFESGSANERWI